jgi:hypothetical protein
MNGMQGAVKRLTDTNSALITLQACMILLFLWQLSTLASVNPHFKLFSGAFQNHLTTWCNQPASAFLPIEPVVF